MNDPIEAVVESPLTFTVMLVIAVLALLALFTRGCSSYNNNRVITSNSYETFSYAQGINGHVEYTKYSNGSQDVKVYYTHSELFCQDFDGDNKADRIRENASRLKAKKLSYILIRCDDYKNNKEKFDEADKLLNELSVKYSK